MTEEQQPLFEISEEEARECERCYEEEGIEGLKALLEKKVNEWKEMSLNIATVGNSGTGKSSFVNAIRNLTADDEGAAEVGVTETTDKPTSYTHPDNKQLKFWDLPGAGTPKFPRETYFEKIGSDKFDFFLVIANNRFTENDKWLANEITQRKKKFFFVRTKVHNDMKNDRDAHPKTHKEETVLDRIREDIRRNLGNLYNDRNVFLIDNYKRNLYDFEKLEQRIVEEFPSIKRDAFILSLSAQSEWMIKEKAKILRKSIWMSCVASAAVALIPFPGTSLFFDMTIVLAQSTIYFHQLGLDEKSLKRTAEIISCDVDILQKHVDDSTKNLLKSEGVASFVRRIPFGTLRIVEGALYLIPIVGSLVVSAISFSTTYTISDSVLAKMEETALLVAQAAAEHSANQLRDNDSEEE